MSQEILPERKNELIRRNLRINASVLELMSQSQSTNIISSIEAASSESLLTVQFAPSNKQGTVPGILEPDSICLQYNSPHSTATHIQLEGYEFYGSEFGWDVYERLIVGESREPELHKGVLGEHHIRQLEMAVQQSKHLSVTEVVVDHTSSVAKVLAVIKQLKRLPLLASLSISHLPEIVTVTEDEVISVDVERNKLDDGPSEDLSNTLLNLIDESEMSYAQSVVFLVETGEQCEVYKNNDGNIVQVVCIFAPESGESAIVQRSINLVLIGEIFMCTEKLTELDGDSPRIHEYEPQPVDFQVTCDVLTIAYNSDVVDELTAG